MVPAQRFQFDSTTHASGGFAKIIRGYDTFLERQVAIKVLDPLLEQATDEDRERFKREARILAKLSHPHIPAIYDVSFDDQFLIVFEFVEGVNLAQHIEKQGPCSLTQARLWCHQIASALQHAHSQGIVHRDVKPANIILKPALETAYLVDFGIAWSDADERRITSSGWVIGTAGYMSPEQESGEEVDHLTDLFSLGVTLYEALAGNRPSIGAYNALSSVNEAIPVEIDNLIQDCLLDRDRRVESADVFSQRLTAALRLQRPLSEVLAQRPLYEMILALRDEELTAEGLAGLPEGQKALILVKLESIVSSDDESLSFPGADLLEVMLTKGVRLPSEEYRTIVNHAIVWAFDKVYPYPPSPSPGRRSLQEALAAICLTANREAHRVLHEEIEQFIGGVDLAQKETWYLHALREVLSALLANTAFTGQATTIASFLSSVNLEQQSRHRTEA